MKLDEIEKLIRVIENFPTTGVSFKDITPVLGNAEAFKQILARMSKDYRFYVTKVVAVESRGFIFGAALAANLGVAFVPARKPGKLPFPTVSAKYKLEYGECELHIHSDAIVPGDEVLIVDDVIATGGTVKACSDIITLLGGNVIAVESLINLSFLNLPENKIDGKLNSVFTY